eukprot:279278-Pelagomonas_calceolata.AAC.1
MKCPKSVRVCTVFLVRPTMPSLPCAPPNECGFVAQGPPPWTRCNRSCSQACSEEKTLGPFCGSMSSVWTS